MFFNIDSVKSWGIGENPKHNAVYKLTRPIEASQYDKNSLKRPNRYKLIIPKASKKLTGSTPDHISYGAKSILTRPLKPSTYDANMLTRPKQQKKIPIGTPYTKAIAMEQFKESKESTKPKDETKKPIDKKEILKQLIKTTTNEDNQLALKQALNYIQRIELIQSKRPLTVEEQKRLDEVNNIIDEYLDKFEESQNQILQEQNRQQRERDEDMKRDYQQQQYERRRRNLEDNPYEEDIQQAYNIRLQQFLEDYPDLDQSEVDRGKRSIMKEARRVVSSWYRPSESKYDEEQQSELNPGDYDEERDALERGFSEAGDRSEQQSELNPEDYDEERDALDKEYEEVDEMYEQEGLGQSKSSSSSSSEQIPLPEVPVRLYIPTDQKNLFGERPKTDLYGEEAVEEKAPPAEVANIPPVATEYTQFTQMPVEEKTNFLLGNTPMNNTLFEETIKSIVNKYDALRVYAPQYLDSVVLQPTYGNIDSVGRDKEVLKYQKDKLGALLKYVYSPNAPIAFKEDHLNNAIKDVVDNFQRAKNPRGVAVGLDKPAQAPVAKFDTKLKPIKSLNTEEKWMKKATEELTVRKDSRTEYNLTMEEFQNAMLQLIRDNVVKISDIPQIEKNKATKKLFTPRTGKQKENKPQYLERLLAVKPFRDLALSGQITRSRFNL